MEITWKYKPFEALSAQELYRIMVLRQEVFVVEQDCPYLDADNKDQPSSHLWGEDSQSRVIAYARIVPPGVSYEEPSIGRIVTAASVRRTGIGKALMRKSFQKVWETHGRQSIRISAQCYLIPFYRAFGFEPVGDSYLEDKIPHIQMLKPA